MKKQLLMTLAALTLLVIPATTFAASPLWTASIIQVNNHYNGNMNRVVVNGNTVMVQWLTQQFMSGEVLIGNKTSALVLDSLQEPVYRQGCTLRGYDRAISSNYGLRKVTYNTATFTLSPGVYYLRPVSYDYLGNPSYGSEAQIFIN